MTGVSRVLPPSNGSVSSLTSCFLRVGIRHRFRMPSSPVLQTLLEAGIVQPPLNKMECDTLLK